MFDGRRWLTDLYLFQFVGRAVERKGPDGSLDGDRTDQLGDGDHSGFSPIKKGHGASRSSTVLVLAFERAGVVVFRTVGGLKEK